MRCSGSGWVDVAVDVMVGGTGVGVIEIVGEDIVGTIVSVGGDVVGTDVRLGEGGDEQAEMIMSISMITTDDKVLRFIIILFSVILLRPPRRDFLG